MGIKAKIEELSKEIPQKEEDDEMNEIESKLKYIISEIQLSISKQKRFIEKHKAKQQKAL